jgi:hydroxymethylbilane synthase
MNLTLHGSCQVPIAGFATFADDRLHLRALVGDAASGEILRAEAHGETSDSEALGREVASQLERLGVRRLLG